MLLVLQSCSAQPSQAEPGTPGSTASRASKQEYIKAADALQLVIGEPGANSSPPDSDSMIVRRYFQQANGLTELLGTPEFPADDLSELETLCAKGNKIVISYGMLGLANRLTKGMPVDQSVPLTRQVVAENSSRYFSLIFPGMLFNQHCIAAFVPSLEKFWRALPKDERTEVRLAGIRQVQRSVSRAIEGMFQIIESAAVPSAIRERAILQLEKDWDNLVLTLANDDREKLKSKMKSVIPRLSSPISDRVKNLVLRLENVNCGELCSA